MITTKFKKFRMTYFTVESFVKTKKIGLKENLTENIRNKQFN